MRCYFSTVTLLAVFLGFAAAQPAGAQTAPSPGEIARYHGLHLAAHKGDLARIRQLARNKMALEARDGSGRTPLIIAAFASHDAAVLALIKAGADPNALDNQKYDIVTIAAVANDLPLLKLALKGGASAKNITSPYVGTALIASAHLGHVDVVKTLIKAGAPLDHVNNLGWTALIEAIVLGDGGTNHIACTSALIKAGADKTIADRNGQTPLQLAKDRGYKKIVDLF